MSTYHHPTDPARLHRRLTGSRNQQHNARTQDVERSVARGERAADRAEGSQAAPVSPNGDSGDEQGGEMLDAVFAFLGRFVAYPSVEAQVAHTLWIAHTHLMDAWESTPRIAFLSPEPGSGKTRALEITGLLVPRPVEAVNMSAAALFRIVAGDDGLPTILYDEVDTVFGNKRTAEMNEDVRGLLNAGHRRGAKSYRCVTRGKEIEVVEYEAYSAVALAGLGDLPDTILSRSVIVRMRRRAAGERVEPYRRRVHGPDGDAIRERLAAWARVTVDNVTDAWPEIPASIQDRDADVWEPLLAVADAAGGNWPATARQAAVSLVAAAKDTAPSLGVRLLSDVRNVFGDADAMSTDVLLKALHDIPEAPWPELVGGKPLNARGLASHLRKYDVKPRVVRIGDHTLRGYARRDLADAWARYLPPLPQPSATSATSDTATGTSAPVSHPFRQNGHRADVADPLHLNGFEAQNRNASATETPRSSGDVADVAEVADSEQDREGRVCVECGAPTAGQHVSYCPVHDGRTSANDVMPMQGEI